MARTRPRFYLLTAIALLVITVWGFSQTYFAPLILNRPSAFGGLVSDLPLIVHLHGWSFFLWYVLLVVQASLIRASKVALHRRLGVLSVGLAAIMVLSGLVIIPVNVYKAMELDGAPIWYLFGPAILATLVLFTLFYILALRNRKRAEFHKRYMLIAGVPALGAAVFRIFLSLLGPWRWGIPMGILVTNLVIVAGIWRDRQVEGKVHRVYWFGLCASLGLELLMLALPHTDAGAAFLGFLSAIGKELLFLYG